MPNDNIERAIKKGTGGGETANFEDLTYEIYGPHGVAMLVEVSTDNRNRTASEIRSLVTKNGGSIATQGSVTRLFHRKGQIIIPREAADEDQLMEVALEAGAEDFKAEPQGYEIMTDPAPFRGRAQADRGQGHQGRRGGGDGAAHGHGAAGRRAGGGRGEQADRRAGRP